MGTSLTPDFWRLFAVLLVVAATLTFVLSAVLDALFVRRLRRRQDRQLTARANRPPDRPSDAPADRTPDHPHVARADRAPRPPRRTPAHR
ncbi:hypothetical protein [Streptomyces capitiformicae]|uniref:Uncharacterized protein n=1 Tax=Streptomyces capitiformicae TaxID=2014920 RepID=A0A918ZK45_9ACTN|nr:hypothetical protein [Streptomyces capitiformicae]GHE55632.1 hypothetical protein GCM10017771_78230 [Streptomyces capitiformicae]